MTRCKGVNFVNASWPKQIASFRASAHRARPTMGSAADARTVRARTKCASARTYCTRRRKLCFSFVQSRFTRSYALDPAPTIEVYICLREQGPVVLKGKPRGDHAAIARRTSARRLDLVDDQPAQFE